MSYDKEVSHDNGHEHDENFHQSDKKAAYHVQFREGMFGCLSDVFDGVAGSAERVSVHDCTQIAVFRQALA